MTANFKTIKRINFSKKHAIFIVSNFIVRFRVLFKYTSDKAFKNIFIERAASTEQLTVSFIYIWLEEKVLYDVCYVSVYTSKLNINVLLANIDFKFKY